LEARLEALAISANIRLAKKNLPRTNTLTFIAVASAMNKKVDDIDYMFECY
jgi:hypothetical protein